MRKFIKKEDLNKHLPILKHYETYVINVLTLYCSLCLGRNYKSIEKIRSKCGINTDLLVKMI